MMKSSIVIALAGLTCISAAPAAQPASLPTTRPTSAGVVHAPPDDSVATPPIAPSRPMPGDFSVLTVRSIFAKGGVTGGAADPALSAESGTSAPEFKTPEEALVFNGVTQTDEGAVAFIENLSTRSVSLAQVGQSIATGKITGIGMHMLEYTAGGKAIRIEIGHNFSGVAVATTQPLAKASGIPSTAPAGGSDEVLERMRKRREQELGGK